MNPRLLRVRYVNVYLRQLDPLSQFMTLTQPIESQREAMTMAARGQSFADLLDDCQKMMS